MEYTKTKKSIEKVFLFLELKQTKGSTPRAWWWWWWRQWAFSDQPFSFFTLLFLSDRCHSLHILNGYWVLKCFYVNPSAIAIAMEAESKGSAPLEAKHPIGPDSELVYSSIFWNFLSLIGLNIIVPSASRSSKCTTTRFFATKFV
jgi:hypothetical protein